MNKITFFCAIILTIAFVKNVYCASFDCSKAKSPIEKSICANPKASKLDDELNVLYRQTMAKFGPEAQKTMYYEQMQWLQTLLEKKNPREIINTYKQRIAEIKQGFANNYNIYTVKNKNISYQQIDAKDEFSNKINSFVKNLVPELVKSVMVLDDLTITIKQISNNIFRVESFCNYSGGAYPDYIRECYYFNKQTGKSLTASDLFDFTNVNYIISVMRAYINPECHEANHDYRKDFWPEVMNVASITATLKNIRNVSLDTKTLNIDLNLIHAIRIAGIFEIANDKIKPFMSEFLRSELKL